MVKSSVETYARKNGFTTVTLQIMDDSKNSSTEGIHFGFPFCIVQLVTREGGLPDQVCWSYHSNFL